MNSFPAQNLQYSVTICSVSSHLTLNSWYRDEYCCYLILVDLKLTKLWVKLELCSILFNDQTLLARMDPKWLSFAWLTGASLPTSMSCPLLGGSCPHAIQHTHLYNPTNLIIFIYNLVNYKTINGRPNLRILEVTGLRLRKCWVAQV